MFPGCKDGRVVADVVRLDKGHTEGLEPKVTEELVKLMLSAPGGKLQKEKEVRRRSQEKESGYSLTDSSFVGRASARLGGNVT